MRTLPKIGDAIKIKKPHQQMGLKITTMGWPPKGRQGDKKLARGTLN